MPVDPAVLADYQQLAQRERLLPVRVTPHYRRLVAEELEALGDSSGPLYRVVYPTIDRLSLRAPGESVDFVDDRANMPGGSEVIIHKYRDRALFLVTDQCAAHCMYCFRQDVIVDQAGRDRVPLDARVDDAIRYLRAHPEISEVILSGGDPVNLSPRELTTIFERLKAETSVQNFRVHTRNAVFAPTLFTDSLCSTLAAHNVRLVLHVVHPYELDNEARAAIQRLGDHRVRCYSQFPILRGINDHPAVLRKLLLDLDDLRVRPLSLFVADPIHYSATYRIPLRRLFSIVDEINTSTASWVNAVRLVLDTPVGKVRREDIVRWNADDGRVVFTRDGHEIVYPDLPLELDVPGVLTTLLWKG